MLFIMLKADELIQIGIHYAELNSNIKEMTTDDSQIVKEFRLTSYGQLG